MFLNSIDIATPLALSSHYSILSVYFRLAYSGKPKKFVEVSFVQGEEEQESVEQESVLVII